MPATFARTTERSICATSGAELSHAAQHAEGVRPRAVSRSERRRKGGTSNQMWLSQPRAHAQRGPSTVDGSVHESVHEVLSVGVGTGQFSKTIGHVSVGHLRGARLVTPTGTRLGIATFAA